MSAVYPCFERLGLTGAPTERDVKRAYAQRLKQIDQVADPAGFAVLRGDYEAALELVRAGVQVIHHVAEFAAQDEPAAPDEDAAAEMPDMEAQRADTVRPSVAEDDAKPTELLQSFRASVLTLDTADVHPLEDVLVQVLRQDALIPFQARSQFEKALLESIALGEFHLHSGAVLLAASSVFHWRSSKGDYLSSQHGDTGAYINRLLEHYYLLPAAARVQWLRRTRQPTADMYQELQDANGDIEFPASELAEFFYSKDHCAKWRAFVGAELKKAPSFVQLVEHFGMEVSQLDSSKVDPMQRVLEAFLSQKSLLSDKAASAFERALVERLALGDFGLHSGAVLFACSTTLGWRKASSILSSCGDPGAYVARLLEAASTLTETEQLFWLRRTLEPGRLSAREIAGFKDLAKKSLPELADFFYPKNHLDKWKIYFSQPSVAIPEVLAKKWRDWFPIVRPYWNLIAVAVGGSLVGYLTFNRSVEKEASWQTTHCDALYAKAVKGDWKGVLVKDLTELSTCATKVFPPLLCEDGDALLDKLSMAEQLQVNLSFYDKLNLSENVLIDLADGRSFGLKPEASCDSVWMIARSMPWLDAGDEPAARAFLRDIASCQPVGADAPNYLRLLQQVDAWPNFPERDAKKTTPLKALLSERGPRQRTASIQYLKPMPVCLASPPSAAPGRGGELGAIQARALSVGSNAGTEVRPGPARK